MSRIHQYLTDCLFLLKDRLMQYQYIGYKIKGFYKFYDYAIKYGIEEDIVKHRLKVLKFWKKHGTGATCDAFTVSRRTLYYWQNKFKNGGEQALMPHNKKNLISDDVAYGINASLMRLKP